MTIYFFSGDASASVSGGRVVGAWAGSLPVLEDLDARSADPASWIERLEELWPELELDHDGAELTLWD